MRAGLHLQRLVSLERGNRDLGAERGLRRVDRCLAIQIVVFAVEGLPPVYSVSVSAPAQTCGIIITATAARSPASSAPLFKRQMRKLKELELVVGIFVVLTLMLGALVVHYRGLLQAGPVELQSLSNRNISFETDFYGLRYRGLSSNLIDAFILYYGAYEKPVLYWLQDTTELLQDGSLVFVDVGANTGQHSLFMSRLVAEVHAFEPYPPVLARLNDTVESNSLANVFVHPVGLGAAHQTLEFFEPPATNQGTGSFVRSYDDSSDGATQLEVVIGDEYLAERGINRVNLMKIDAEGYEKNVLAGLAKTLERERPVVVLEVTVARGQDQLFTNQNELIAAFPANYEFAILPDEPASEDFRTGRYEVTPFTATSPSFLFDSQWTVIAFPSEEAAKVSRSGAAKD